MAAAVKQNIGSWQLLSSKKIPVFDLSQRNLLILCYNVVYNLCFFRSGEVKSVPIEHVDALDLRNNYTATYRLISSSILSCTMSSARLFGVK
jgi:hypothetical protein